MMTVMIVVLTRRVMGGGTAYSTSDTISFSGYSWTLNNGTASLSSDESVLTVTPASSGVSLQLADSELSALYEKYPEGFSVIAKVRPDLSNKQSSSAFASNGNGNFGVVSNVTSSGFYGSFVNSNGRMQLGTYQTAKGLQFGSLLTDPTGKIFKTIIDEPYVIRLNVSSDVLSSSVNGIECNKSGTIQYTVPEEAKVTRSASAGSYGILTEFTGSYELYSFEVCGLKENLAAIKMQTSETKTIATLKENAAEYVFLNDCSYTTGAGEDAVTFTVTAADDSGADVTSAVTAASSDESIVTVSETSAEGGSKVISVTPAAEGSATVTVTSGDLTRKITVTVEAAKSYVDTDYELATALDPANGDTGVCEDTHLVLTFDDTPVLGEGYIEIYDSSNTAVDKISVDSANSNKITDGNGTATYSLKNFMVQVVGKTVEIIPSCGVLENGKTYHVGIAEGVISGKINSKTFTGFDPDTGRWTFTVRSEKPASSSSITVGSSDSADYRTVQGAFKAVTEDSTITVEKGTYREILYYSKSYDIKLVGDTKTEYGSDVIIQGINCNAYNGSSDTRAAFHFKSSADLTLKNITIQNAYDRNTMGGTAQSEALYFNSTGHLAAFNSSFLGHQDTLLTKGKNWFYKCYIEGDTDFIWGYADACLIEESKVVQLDTSSDTVSTSGSYVFETRVGSDAASSATVGKGYVLFNTELVSNHPKSYIARRASASGSSGNNYYDQFAAVNVTVSSDSSNSVTGVFGGSNTAVYIDADSDRNQNVGGKVYGCTGITADSAVSGSGSITESVYTAEYSGRAVILNKVYKKTGKYANDTNIWYYSDLESEFEATEDNSSLEEEKEVEGANGTYDICTLAENATGASSYTQNTVLTDGKSSDGYVSWKNLLWHSGSSSYGVVTSKTDSSVITVYVAGASVVSWTSSTYSNGTVTVTDSSNNTIVNAVSTKTATDKSSEGFIYTGTEPATLTLTFSKASTYINNLVVSVLDDETDSVSSISLSGSGTVAAGETIALTATVSAAYLSTDTGVTWSSSDEGVATVDDSGTVTGVAAGTAVITAASTATPSVSATKEITVTATAAEPVAGQTYTYSLTGGIGTPYTSDDGFLKVTANSDNGGHGLVMKDGNTIVLKVAGSGTITLGTCAYDKACTVTVTASSGSQVGDAVSISAGNSSYDNTTADITYTGDADTLTLTYSDGKGGQYLHSVTFTPSSDS